MVESATRGQREPKYWALKQHLLDLLDSRPPGSPIPTERALATEFTVSRTTVRQALADLTAEGRLHRVQGKGTFAAEPKLAQRLQLSSYTEDMRAQGREPSSKLLEIEELASEPDLAKLLGQPAKVLRKLAPFRVVCQKLRQILSMRINHLGRPGDVTNLGFSDFVGDQAGRRHDGVPLLLEVRKEAAGDLCRLHQWPSSGCTSVVRSVERVEPAGPGCRAI